MESAQADLASDVTTSPASCRSALSANDGGESRGVDAQSWIYWPSRCYQREHKKHSSCSRARNARNHVRDAAGAGMLIRTLTVPQAIGQSSIVKLDWMLLERSLAARDAGAQKRLWVGAARIGHGRLSSFCLVESRRCRMQRIGAFGGNELQLGWARRSVSCH
jgi:hypothetical protein